MRELSYILHYRLSNRTTSSQQQCCAMCSLSNQPQALIRINAPVKSPTFLSQCHIGKVLIFFCTFWALLLRKYRPSENLSVLRHVNYSLKVLKGHSHFTVCSLENLLHWFSMCLYECLCAHACCADVYVDSRVQISCVSSILPCGLQGQTQVARLGGKPPYLLSHLADPHSAHRNSVEMLQVWG